MTRTEFLEVIYKESGFMTASTRRQVMSHFTKLFTESNNDDELIGSLGTPEEALRRHLNSAKTTSKIPKPLFIAAILLLSPFIISISIIALTLIAILIILAIAILAIISLLGLSLWLKGAEIVFASIPQAVILADKLWQIGIGLMYFAGGIVIMLLVYKLYSKLIPWILSRFSALYHRIENRRAK